MPKLQIMRFLWLLLPLILASCIVKSKEFDEWKRLSADNQDNIIDVLEQLNETFPDQFVISPAQKSQKRLNKEAEKESGFDFGGIAGSIITALINGVMAQLGLGGLLGGGGMGLTGMGAAAYFYRKKRKSDRIAHMAGEKAPEEARDLLERNRIHN